ncbi:MAG: hypothetical protein ACXWL9_00070 [Syntrophales bacterium]
MGFPKWLVRSRKGHVSGTAKTVAEGWKTIQERNPGMSPMDIAHTYVRKRYTAIGDLHLAKEVLRMLHNVNPLNLSWAILMVENKDESINLYDRMSEWQHLMIREIRKHGIDPE